MTVLRSRETSEAKTPTQERSVLLGALRIVEGLGNTSEFCVGGLRSEELVSGSEQARGRSNTAEFCIEFAMIIPRTRAARPSMEIIVRRISGVTG